MTDRTKTRCQLLWIFQLYLDQKNIHDPERRERLSGLYLDRGLTRDMEREFSAWLKTRHLMPERSAVMRTRGSRLAYFSAWLNQFRPWAPQEERERLIRLYNAKAIDRDIERQFHQYVRASIEDRRMLP